MVSRLPPSCSDHALISFTDISGIFLQFRDRESDRAVGTAAGGKYSGEPFQGYIEIDIHAVLYRKGADTAHRMADQVFHFLRREHLCFRVELFFVFTVIDPGIPGGYDQQGMSVSHE